MDELDKIDGNQYPSQSQLSPQGLRDLEVVDVSPEEIPHLLDYWAIVLKRRWLVLVCAVVVFSTVALGTLKERPVYEGKVTIEIDPEPPSVVNFKEIVNISPVDIDSYRETQFKILQSRTLAERVVRNLQLYKQPEFYKGRILFGLFTPNPRQLPSLSDPNPPDPSADYFVNAVAHLQDFEDISPLQRSNLVKVAFDSYSPDLAARVANQIAEDYIQQNLETKWDETEAASKWLGTRLVSLKAKLEESEDALQAYAQSHSIIFLKDNETITSARMVELMGEYTKAQEDLFEKESLYSFVKGGKVEDLPQVRNDAVVQNLEVQKTEMQKQYAMVTAWVKPDYPKARQIQREIDSVRKQEEKERKAVVQNIINSYKTAQHRVSSLADAVDGQKKVMNDVNQEMIQYSILKREVDSNNQLYDGLLERMKEAQVSSGLKSSNIHVVDNAIVPRSPVKPRVFLDLTLGLVLGIGLGVGLAFFQEYLDKTLKTSDDVEHLLRLPSLGMLPRFSLNGVTRDGARTAEEHLVPVSSNGHSDLAPGLQTASESVEAFRSLRTSILLSASPVPRLLLVTSAVPSEGKTTAAVNLGAALASLGKSVVLVDCDMRRPAVHRSTGVENRPGFVQCLTGHVDLAAAILPVPGVNNFSVIPCGPIPPNPAEVLSSKLTAELLRKLRSQFEFVLVDSPPILSVADSRILATLTDAAILITRAHSTPYDVVRRARSLLYGAGCRILGVALNAVDFEREGYGYSSGQYGFGYGYGRNGNSNPSGDSATTG
ncbi:MAG TPA: polysaccharide biosynthesis tyrosine autokinase [Terriglobia bacterium]|nr:polysaccharide biosynthesis tyrosine autokinase [Terriglobia bacterium]